VPDLMTLLANFSSAIPPLLFLLQAIATLMGVWFTAGALAELWGVSHENASRYLPGNKNFSTGGAFVKLFIGGTLCAMGTLQMVGIMTRTFTDDYVASRFLSYTATDNSFDQQKLAAMSALLGIMQVVGFIAMIKGWTTINQRAEGRSGAVGYGVAAAWLVGGILCWNFKWTTDMINCQFGYNVIGIFTSINTPNACAP
jgi:hypothetical protein